MSKYVKPLTEQMLGLGPEPDPGPLPDPDHDPEPEPEPGPGPAPVDDWNGVDPDVANVVRMYARGEIDALEMAKRLDDIASRVWVSRMKDGEVEDPEKPEPRPDPSFGIRPDVPYARFALSVAAFCSAWLAYRPEDRG